MKFPIMLYDDQCSVCAWFAKTVDRLAGGRLTIMGHYTKEGRRLRASLLYPEATEMFWMLEEHEARGGRGAILPLLRRMVTARGGTGLLRAAGECQDTCSVWARSASIMTRSGHVRY